MSLKLLKQIDKRTKCTVYGWIRELEAALNIPHIPTMISSICILYFREDEIFSTISQNGSELSQNKKMITKMDIDHDNDNNNYGLIMAPSNGDCIYKWD